MQGGRPRRRGGCADPGRAWGRIRPHARRYRGSRYMPRSRRGRRCPTRTRRASEAVTAAAIPAPLPPSLRACHAACLSSKTRTARGLPSPPLAPSVAGSFLRALLNVGRGKVRRWAAPLVLAPLGRGCAFRLRLGRRRRASGLNARTLGGGLELVAHSPCSEHPPAASSPVRHSSLRERRRIAACEAGSGPPILSIPIRARASSLPPVPYVCAPQSRLRPGHA